MLGRLIRRTSRGAGGTPPPPPTPAPDEETEAMITTTAQFTMPAAGSEVVVSVDSSARCGVPQVRNIPNVGDFAVVSVPDSSHVQMRNLGTTGSLAAGQTVASGSELLLAGPAGPAGADGDPGATGPTGPTGAPGEDGAGGDVDFEFGPSTIAAGASATQVYVLELPTPSAGAYAVYGIVAYVHDLVSGARGRVEFDVGVESDGTNWAMESAASTPTADLAPSGTSVDVALNAGGTAVAVTATPTATHGIVVVGQGWRRPAAAFGETPEPSPDETYGLNAATVETIADLGGGVLHIRATYDFATEAQAADFAALANSTATYDATNDAINTAATGGTGQQWGMYWVRAARIRDVQCVARVTSTAQNPAIVVTNNAPGAWRTTPTDPIASGIAAYYAGQWRGSVVNGTDDPHDMTTGSAIALDTDYTCHVAQSATQLQWTVSGGSINPDPATYSRAGTYSLALTNYLAFASVFSCAVRWGSIVIEADIQT